MKKYIIIVAGGSGTRMNSEVPKQFIELKGKPILMHTIEKFHTCFPEINVIVALAETLNNEWMQLCDKYNFNIPHQLTAGGETRFHSVKNALTKLPDDNCIVGIHDAARPLVSSQTIVNAFETAAEKGNAIPSISLSESLREVSGENNKAVDRSNYRIVQTPQCFQSSILKKAFEQEYSPAFTDDASVLESIGERIFLIEGNRENIKITTPQDLILAEALFQSN